MKVLLLTSLFLASFVSQAAKSVPVARPVPAPGMESYSWMSDDEYTQAKSAAKSRAERSIAAAHEVNDQLMSPGAKHFRDRFLKISTAHDLKALLSEMNANYEKYPDDLKLITALMTPLLKFKAFTYRVYPYLSSEKITHSLILSQAQNIASFMTMNLPTAQWRAGFDLVTQPGDEEDLKRFNTASDLQNFLIRDVYPAYLTAAKRVQGLSFAKKPVVWDNKVLYGTASFSDNLNRFQLVGEGERLALLSALHNTLGAMCKFAVYDINTLLPALREVTKLYGYDSFFSAVDGVTARKITGVYHRPEFATLFTLRENGEANSRVAFRHMKEGSRALKLSWLELKDRNDNNQAFIRAAIFTPFTQTVDTQVDELENILSGKTSIRSDVTGEVVAVDLPAFYQHPPHDLKDLLPTEFDQSPNTNTYTVRMNDGKTKSVQFRNYFSGGARGWNVMAYKTLLPDLTKSTDVGHAMKILNQSISGALPGEIIQPFMLY